MTPAELRAARKSLGMTQTAMAAAMGVRRATISELEHGKYPVTKPYELAVRYLLLIHQEREP